MFTSHPPQAIYIAHLQRIMNVLLVQMIAPELEKMAQEYGEKVLIAKLNCSTDDNNKRLAIGELLETWQPMVSGFWFMVSVLAAAV